MKKGAHVGVASDQQAPIKKNVQFIMRPGTIADCFATFKLFFKLLWRHSDFSAMLYGLDTYGLGPLRPYQTLSDFKENQINRAIKII